MTTFAKLRRNVGYLNASMLLGKVVKKVHGEELCKEHFNIFQIFEAKLIYLCNATGIWNFLLVTVKRQIVDILAAKNLLVPKSSQVKALFTSNSCNKSKFCRKGFWSIHIWDRYRNTEFPFQMLLSLEFPLYDILFSQVIILEFPSILFTTPTKQSKMGGRWVFPQTGPWRQFNGSGPDDPDDQ